MTVGTTGGRKVRRPTPARKPGVPREPGRAAAIAVASVLVLLLGAGPALADTAHPTNYRSTVTTIDPVTEGVELKVVGGDAFLQLNVAPGHEVFVPGYYGEPYLRVDADQSVWASLDSQAYYLNQDRYARVLPPADADGEGDPRWVKVSDDGSYAWHDHRTHWMNYDRPPSVSPGQYQVIFPWKFFIEVDGREVTVTGLLEWIPSRLPVAPVLIGIVAIPAVVIWRRPRWVVPAALLAASAMATVVALSQNAGTPVPARPFPTRAVLPAVAFVAAAGALLLLRRERVSSWLVLLGTLLLVVWGFTAVNALWRPELPGPLPSGLERAGIAIVLATGLTALVLWAIGFWNRLRAPDEGAPA